MWEKIKKTLKSIWTVIEYIALAAFFGIAAIFLFRKPKDRKENNIAEKAREDKRNELEEKTPDDIAADSPNPDTISANIEQEQEKLRQRLRDRFKKNIPGNGSSSDN